MPGMSGIEAKSSHPAKFVRQDADGGKVIEGLLVPFSPDGGETVASPFDGLYFTADTRFNMGAYQDPQIVAVPDMPLLFGHNYERKTRGVVFGRNLPEETRLDETGLWVQSVLFNSVEYGKDLEDMGYESARDFSDAVEALIETGRIGFSSGSVSHFVRVNWHADRGEITNWPVVEQSLTERPAQPETIPVTFAARVAPEWMDRYLIGDHAQRTVPTHAEQAAAGNSESAASKSFNRARAEARLRLLDL